MENFRREKKMKRRVVQGGISERKKNKAKTIANSSALETDRFDHFVMAFFSHSVQTL